MKNFVYSDYDRTLKRDNSGNTVIHYDGDAIIQSIKTIFSTISGERVRNPLGSTLIRLLFEPMNQETADSIKTIAAQAISQYEPRVIVEGIRIIPNYNQNFYYVEMKLRVKKLNKIVRFETQLRSLYA